MKFTKTQRGWAMYDWANSVYSLVISTVLFPLYYEAVTKNETNEVLFLGRYWENTVVYSYVIAAKGHLRQPPNLDITIFRTVVDIWVASGRKVPF